MHKYMLMNKIEETAPAGGDTAKVVVGYVAEEPKKEATATHDDYGYPITPKELPPTDVVKEAVEAKAAEAKKEAAPPEEKEIVAATGYEEKAPEAPAKKEAAATEAKEVKEELELDVKDLPEEDAKSIKDFAKKHGVTKEVAQAMADMKKEEYKQLDAHIAKSKADQEAKVQETRHMWHSELKNDPTFGGEKFAYNIKQAEKVVDEFMPNLKAQLVVSKTMLPPYVMKDLAKLAKHLYSSERLTQGNPIVETKANDDQEDHLAFYT